MSRPETVSPRTLCIGVVVYDTDWERLRQTLVSTREAVACGAEQGGLEQVELRLVDNKGVPGGGERLRQQAAELWQGAGCGPVQVLAPGRNLGYGVAANLALEGSEADFLLVLNPDVSPDRDALVEAVRYLAEHPGVGLLSPRAVDGEGRRQYLCKTYPTLLILLLRGFLPGVGRVCCPGYLARYELRGVTEDEPATGDFLVSGCFMFFRRETFRAAGGFDDAYFLYFEDFDLSLRAAEYAAIAYVPSVRIVHHGGGAARKGLRHILLFVRSAWRFFRSHGWRWF